MLQTSRERARQHRRCMENPQFLECLVKQYTAPGRLIGYSGSQFQSHMREGSIRLPSRSFQL